MFATGWRRLSHRDGPYDDLNPPPAHAEAVVQWQSRALRLMWEAAFGLALWHSGDSWLGRQWIPAADRAAPAIAGKPPLICVNAKQPRT